jgi:hypothetical protein
MHHFPKRWFEASILLFLVFAVPPLVWAQGQTSATSTGAGESSPASRIVFGATAHSLPAGEGYVQVGALIFPRFQVGVTDRLSVGAGTVIFYPRVAVVTPKLQVYRSSRTSAAIGIIHLFGVPHFGAGLAYAVGTRDTRNGSLTAGFGVVYARSPHDGGQALVGLIGGESRRSAHDSALFEACVTKGSVLATVAGRHTWTRFALDYGVMISAARYGVTPAPVVNLSWRF